MACEPFRREVFPRWISALNQPNFLFAVPAFELLLAIDGAVYVIEGFEVHETGHK